MKKQIVGMLDAMAPRERLLVLVGGAFLLCVGLWFGVAEPLREAAKKADRVLPELRRQTAEMHQLASEVNQLKAKASQPPLSPETATLVGEASQRGFSPRIIETGDGGFAVHLDGVAMSRLVEWLSGLSGGHRLYVREARLNDAGEGLVSGELVLGQ
jgi:type II secretory pathway component PulM